MTDQEENATVEQLNTLTITKEESGKTEGPFFLGFDLSTQSVNEN
jgi:hypothetical protein